ncbi:hypothetical protein CDL15_Pgr011361 [Punica granatum]|uniref:Uncharacterized protein n=1 Tax=Punica granatum TaxID=22663 RepID=A0A218WEF7_PUNGR|nr:hypothetical protein CDL15_Pgr011361 [Punica granatum]
MPQLASNSDKLDPDSIRAVIAAINESIGRLLGNPDRWNDLKAKCIFLLAETRKEMEFFEFSESSVISNLYWGIEGIESVMRAKGRPKESDTRLKDSEQMLQVPALLEEHGTTSGIPNGYLVGLSYFYLAVVKRLQGDDWQVAMHFVQSLLVAPGLIGGVLAPELCESLFPSRARESTSAGEIGEDRAMEEGAIGKLARRYRDRLMYYRVVLYNERLPGQDGNGCSGRDPPDNESGCSGDTVSKSSDDSLYENENGHFQVTDSKAIHFSKEQSLKGDPADELDWTKDHGYFDRGSGFHTHGDEEEKTSTETKKRLQDMLKEPQTDSELDSPSSSYSPIDAAIEESEELSKEVYPSNLSQSFHHRPFDGDYGVTEVKITNIVPHKVPSPINDFSSSISKLRDQKQELQLFDQIAATSRRAAPRKRHKSSSSNKDNLRKCPVKDPQTDLLVIFEKVISKLCFSEGLAKLDEEESVLEITAIYEMLNNKKGVKYTMLKEVILDQLLTAISTSNEERLVRMSVCILTTIASGNHSVLRDIKRKGLQLCDLANALKRNVHEAATLIYLIKPTPTEIKTLELLPTLVEVICSRSNYSKLNKLAIEIPLTPPVASLMIIKVLVTAFDCSTNTTHLAVINSPRVLHGLIEVARDSGGEESIALATIIVKCMRFDGQCRAHISQFTPVAPFLGLLQSKKKQAKLIALEFFHEILCMPRSAAVGLLHRVRKEGGANLMQSLLLYVRSLESHHRLFAANLLIQLDVLDNSPSRSGFSEAAMQVLLDSMSTEEDQLSAFILSNLGGTYAWTGEPYTIPWLVKKAGLTSRHHRNLIRDVDWEDQILQDTETDSWCSKVARSVILIGKPVFETLGKGLKSKSKQISRDYLTATAWLGFEISKGPHGLRYSAFDVIIGGLEQFLHPGVDLEERVLALLCIYNYGSGKGMQKLVHFSEGVRESLRRLSGISWMAEELHKVADYYLPNKSRISCVHTQVLEAGQSYSGPVNALIYYKGLLWSGHSDGSIKVWDIKGQTATLVWDRKEHKKAVTCFSLFEHGENLLSGSSDRTIKVWKMIQRKLECIEVISINEPIKQLETHGKMILVVPQGHGIKALDSSRKIEEICKSRKVKCVSVIQGKIYAGCKDSSIQELALANYREREIKAASKRWMLQRKPISSIFAYKDWIYTAGSGVEGSNIKEWRRNYEVQTKIPAERAASVVAMGVVEDFVYLSSTSCPSVLQIWLRGTQQKVGRISAGSKITSLLTANDVVICGTEAGLIKVSDRSTDSLVNDQ